MLKIGALNESNARLCQLIVDQIKTKVQIFLVILHGKEWSKYHPWYKDLGAGLGTQVE
jgi:hypothetical protein